MNNKQTSKFSIDTRTILVVVISLSTLSVVRQLIIIQLLVMAVTLGLLWLRMSSFAKLIHSFQRLKRIIPLIISLAAMQLLFRRGGDVYWQYGLLQITEAGLTYALTVSMRIINLILITGLLFNVSSTEYLIAFKTWKIPYEISFLVTAIIRFIPDYLRMFNNYRETLLLRGISFKKLPLKPKMTALVILIRTALTDALTGVTFRAISLDMKGFRLYPQRTYLYDAKLRQRDLFVQVAVVLVTILLLVAL